MFSNFDFNFNLVLEFFFQNHIDMQESLFSENRN